jgi:hypothetical protein
MATLGFTNMEGNHEEITDYELFGYIRTDFFYDQINRPYIRGLLAELGFSPCEIFGLMELLGIEREKWGEESRDTEANVIYT